MVELTPSLLGNSLIVLFITYAITLGYSLYMVFLSWKQSKVLDEIKRTNVLLESIYNALQKEDIREEEE